MRSFSFSHLTGIIDQVRSNILDGSNPSSRISQHRWGIQSMDGNYMAVPWKVSIACLLAVLCTVDVAADTPFDKLKGKWSSRQERIGTGNPPIRYTMTFDGSNIADFSVGKIYFDSSSSDGLLTGYWVELYGGSKCSSEKHGSRYWGTVQLQFNDAFDEFAGVWRHCDASLEYPWAGERGVMVENPPLVTEASSQGITLEKPSGGSIQSVYSAAKQHCESHGKKNVLITSASPRFVFACY